MSHRHSTCIELKKMSPTKPWQAIERVDMNTCFKNPVLITALCAVFGGLMATSTAFATDHGDTALLNGVARNDARLTDYFALNRGDNIAFIIDTNPTIGAPASAQQSTYVFPTDVKFTANIDNRSAVNFDDPVRNVQHGGTVTNPAGIKENFTFTFTFATGNVLSVNMSSPDTELGISGFYPTEVNQGDLVYVLGSGFNSDETKVKVKGRRAPFSRVLSDNVMVFIAPFGGKTGAITVSTETENEATDTESKARVTSASELVINKFKGFNPDSIAKLNSIIRNTAATDAIKAGNALALADIGLPVKAFAGMRDDPFIRLPQQGRNIAAMALELPQSLFTHGRQKILLSWGASGFDAVTGASSDVAGRSFATMFSPEQFILNTLHPSQHVAALEAAEIATTPILMPCQTPFQPLNTTTNRVQLRTDCAPGQRMLKSPDVIIFDTTKTQNFPNGRELTNDQIDSIGTFDPRVENVRRGEMTASGTDRNGLPFVLNPSQNDVPHDTNFPYLGLPQN